MKKASKTARPHAADTDDLVVQVREFYVNSHDFNGIPLSRLAKQRAERKAELTGRLESLIKSGLVAIATTRHHPNPHIRARDIPVEDQLAALDALPWSEICVYPTPKVMKARYGRTKQYEKEPYTRRLFMGEPQLAFVFFELAVLDRYFKDPRYHFYFSSSQGRLSVHDDYYLSDAMPERDKVLLEHFGLGYNEHRHPVVVVYLRYLTQLSPEHQQAWASYESHEKCKLSQSYYETSILGKFPTSTSIYGALLAEQCLINEMAAAMGRPLLFRTTYEDDGPADYTFFVPPTQANFNSFVQCLDKLLSDNLNVEFFQGDVERQEVIKRKDGTEEVRQKGTLRLLDEWLRQSIELDEECLSTFDDIKAGLKKVRDLRNKPSHAVVGNVYDPGLFDVQRELIEAAYMSVFLIRRLFEGHPACRRVKVPDWLREGRIHTP